MNCLSFETRPASFGITTSGAFGPSLQVTRSSTTGFRPLSRQYLTSPLNHIEGQDGPDDFDRPQTIASYSAVVSAVMWGVDFAETAVMQIFECLDLKYDGEFPGERTAEVAAETRWIRECVTRVVAAQGREQPGLTPDLLARIRR